MSEQTINGDPPVRDRDQWLGVGTGVIAWALHLFILYVLVDQVCRNGWLAFTAAGMTGLQFTSLVLTVIAIALTAAGGWLSWRGWRRVRAVRAAAAPQSDTLSRTRFMTAAGMILSIGFIAVMLLTFIPSFVVAPCR